MGPNGDPVKLDVRVKGLGKVLRNLDSARKRVEKGVELGLKAAGEVLEEESQRLVPVETGELRDSSYTRSTGRGLDTRVYVGYSAGHAVSVHEDLGAEHDPGKSAKFLETPAREQRAKLTAAAARKAKL